MTALRRRMTEDLQLAGYALNTILSEQLTVQVLAKYFMRSPDPVAALCCAPHKLYFVMSGG